MIPRRLFLSREIAAIGEQNGDLVTQTSRGNTLTVLALSCSGLWRVGGGV